METLKRFAETNLMVCCCLSLNGEIIYHNQFFESLFPNPRGRNFKAYLDPLCLFDYKNVMEEAFEQPNKLITLKLTCTTTGHITSWFCFSVLYDSKDRVYAVMGVKGGEEESFEPYVQQVMKDNLREIAYIQSHVIRAHLVKILGASQLAEVSTSLDEVKEYSAIIHKHALLLDEDIKRIIGLTFI